ncbi:MAG: family 2 glycosyl transferase [Pelodictyon luteolum]|uniref:Family 2 glycosyl transferase n=1 Tax=Pelodictyon luteolum TaxID=1100 RepID=A0A165MG00_PELLU|nr:glycosyltransferase family 2 protein [Pelodictyon luteolum]KZK75203.1 MAG: family 2 glycosyl transferase [Pelodictyon luteolum]
MKCSLVITTYNWPEALELSLMSAIRQSEAPDEVIVADDGSRSDTARLVEEYRQSSSIPVRHVWQDDEGYRLSASRNRAVAAANGDYIVIVDGDMVLHPDFIGDHKRLAQQGTFIQGSRVLLFEENTKQRFMRKETDISPFEQGIGNRKNAVRLPWLAGVLAIKGSALKGIRGCNISFFRSDCIRVNGFNEDFVGWGREDSEFVVRLFNSGVLRRNVRFSAIAAHLWHKENTRHALPENDRLLERAITEKQVRCPNGIDKYLEKQ